MRLYYFVLLRFVDQLKNILYIPILITMLISGFVLSLAGYQLIVVGNMFSVKFLARLQLVIYTLLELLIYCAGGEEIKAMVGQPDGSIEAFKLCFQHFRAFKSQTGFTAVTGFSFIFLQLISATTWQSVRQRVATDHTLAFQSRIFDFSGWTYFTVVRILYDGLKQPINSLYMFDFNVFF